MAFCELEGGGANHQSYKEQQEAHAPQLAHLIKTVIHIFNAMQLLPVLPQQLGHKFDHNCKKEAHGPQLAHLSEIATADMQMLYNISSIPSLQLIQDGHQS